MRFASRNESTPMSAGPIIKRSATAIKASRASGRGPAATALSSAAGGKGRRDAVLKTGRAAMVVAPTPCVRPAERTSGLARQLGSIADVQLLQQLTDVGLDRVRAQVNLDCYFPVRVTLDQERKDLVLQLSQVGGGGFRRRRRSGPLQPVMHAGVVDGNGSLAAQRLEELLPLLVRLKLTAMKDLEHPRQLSTGDQRHRTVGAEALSREERAPAKLGEGP